MPKVSVIIPVYNTEKYLPKCLDSVCQQTLTDIEIICINDCSADNSLQVLREYAEKDSRIKIIDFKENKGAASARNAGIEAAAGEYVAFLDSDDYIDLDFYEKLYCAAAEANADCAKGNYKDAVTGYVDPLLNQKIEEYQTNFAYAYCSAIFKRAVIQNNAIKFPVLIDMEDPVFTLNFALLMNKIVIVNDACIHILRREDSSTSGIPTFERIKAKFKGLEIILDIANSVNMPKESYAYILAFWFQQTFANSIINKNSKERAFIAENIASLYNKITVKELFIKELMQKDEVLVDGLKNNDKKLLMQYGCNTLYNKSIFLSLRNKIKTAANPKISVVIPVYNAKDYLERCLDSVCNQTLKELEIICVNDCSTDNSLEILNKYAQNDKRIIVIDCTVNGGESKARNLGIEKACGEFIAFVDNDDKIDLDFYEKLYQKAKETNADIVKGNVVIIDFDGKTQPGYVNPILKRTKNKWHFFAEWWSAIYKASIIKENTIRLPEGYILGGDVLFLKECLFYAKRVEFIDDTAYYWIRRENSGESLILNKDKMSSALSVFAIIQKKINTWYVNKQIDDENYDSITKNCLGIPGDYIFRNNQPECKELCAEYFITYYQNCLRKNSAKKYLQEEFPYLILSIINNNKEELYNKILKIKDKDDLRKKNRLAAMRNKTIKTSPKISVIIPVYNAGQYLERCLDSVCSQTLKELEIISVNDCSTDNSLEILNRYAQNDKRIIVIDCKVNGGESKARNLGLEKASGEFIAFVDNDDKIDLDFYEKLYRKAKETNADIVKGNTITTDYAGMSHQSYINPRITLTKNKWFFYAEWWSAIYKAAIIKENNLKLPESNILGGDVLFLNEALFYANKVEIVDDTAYHWIRRENSGESLVLSKEKIASALDIYDKIQTNINTWYINRQIDAESYDSITKNCLWLPGNYIFRNNQAECKELCAAYFIKYYQNCLRKNSAKKYLQEEFPYFFLSIINNKKDELYNKMIKIMDKTDYNKKNKLAELRNKTIKISPKVSVIIPVYNTAQYLERCLHSVCNQTLTDIEIICVNDCSPDNSMDILKRYAENDDRIKIINFKENKGVSVARNIGIEQAEGEYIGFVDSDDYIDLDFYEKLYKKAQETNADIVKANAEIHNFNNTKILRSLNNEISQNGKFCFTCFFWTAIYSRKMIIENNIEFPLNYCLGEDVYFLNLAVVCANRVDFVNNALYYYIRRENSADSEILNEKQTKSVVEIYLMLIDIFNQHIKTKQEYLFAHFYWYKSLIRISHKCINIENAACCAQGLIEFYKKCLYKDALLVNLKKECDDLEFDCIINNKKDELTQYYFKCNTEQKRIVANLRYKRGLIKGKNL